MPAKPDIQVISSDKIPQPVVGGPHPQGLRVGNLLFLSGQLASDFKTGVPKEARRDPNFPYYTSDIKLQTKYILENFKTLLEENSSSLDYVVKAQVFLVNLNDFAGFDEVWKQYFKRPPPRATVGVAGLLVPGCLVEIDLTAVVPEK
jgi:reactive intermediate/imine deaminase